MNQHLDDRGKTNVESPMKGSLIMIIAITTSIHL